jgi:hypothetical protein
MYNSTVEERFLSILFGSGSFIPYSNEYIELRKRSKVSEAMDNERKVMTVLLNCLPIHLYLLKRQTVNYPGRLLRAPYTVVNDRACLTWVST